MFQGLAHMHNLGIAHMDIDLDNLLYDGHTFRMADFGLAKRAGEMTATNRLIGRPSVSAKNDILELSSPTFDAPLSLEIRQSMDVFAMGLMLWRMTTGTQSYWMTSTIDRTHDSMQLAPNAQAHLKRVKQIYGEEVADIMLRAMHPDRKLRASAEECAQIFEKIDARMPKSRL